MLSQRYDGWFAGESRNKNSAEQSVYNIKCNLIHFLSEQLSEAIDDIDEDNDNDNDDKFVWPTNHRDNDSNDDRAIIINGMQSIYYS